MGMLFPKSFQNKTPRSQIKDLTLKGFGGGLNSVDDDFSMEPKYSKTLRNFRRTPSGGQQLRFGSNWFADVQNTVTGNIMDMVYFNGRLVVVMDSGQIATVDDLGIVRLGWNGSISHALPGSPNPWGNAFVAVSFVPFKDTLVIHNGVDKPLSISSAFVFTYLQDLATGSNVNVPIGKFGTVASNYHCIGGIPGQPTTIYIGAVGTSGTFPGDPIPNDSISIDVGAYSPQGAVTIRGLAGYRNFLIVFFQGQALLVTLGTYDASGTHKPQFPDTLPKFGLLGHRCFTPVEHDIIFTGLDGYSDGKRNLFSGLVTSDHVSDRIEPFYRQITGNLTDAQQQNSCFLVHDPLWHDTILFNPSGRHFVHTGSENLHYSAWSEFSFPFTPSCACASFLGRLFYATGTRIFQHGNAIFTGENYTADRLNDRDTYWNVNTPYTVGQLVRDDGMNLLYDSNNFAATEGSAFFLWSNQTSTMVNNIPITSPDPQRSAWSWTRTALTTSFFGQEVGLTQPGNIASVPVGSPITYSMFAHQGLVGARYLCMYLSDIDNAFLIHRTIMCIFDLQNGTAAISSNLGDGIGSLAWANPILTMVAVPGGGGGWWRCSITVTSPTGPNPAKYARCFWSFNNVNGDLFATDNVLSNGYVYGMSLEARGAPGPYVENTSKVTQIFTNVTYTCKMNHVSGTLAFAFDRTNNPNFWTQYTGLPISFEMELPWLSGKDPMRTKQLRFANVTTLGTAEFTLEVYVDRLYKNANGSQIFQPALSLPFIAGDSPGFGFDAGPMGGGRRGDDPRLMGFPVKFKLIKPRFIGSSTKPLQIVSTGFLYSRGSYKR